MTLNLIKDSCVDGENNAVIFDAAYAFKGPINGETITPLIQEIKDRHGPDVGFVPMGGKSGGGGIFQMPKPEGRHIIGIQFVTPAEPRTSHSNNVEITKVGLDEIIINAHNNEIYAGAAITLAQLNLALSEHMGHSFRVLGADLTSYTYAQVGATFMTGGMGPQRRYFSDSVREIALHNGENTLSVTAPSLAGYAGTYGWTGIVCAVKCRYHQTPENEIAFAIPVSNTSERLAKLLNHFSPYAYLNLENDAVKTTQGKTDLILGLEHVTKVSMQPLFAQGGNADVISRANGLVKKCDASASDGLIFVNGLSNQTAEDFLLSLVDQDNDQTMTIAGIDLEHTEIFNDPEQMRSLREAIPFAARTQGTRGVFSYKGHTDANIRLNPENIEETMIHLWDANTVYVKAISDYFSKHDELFGEILVYGHLNPVGVDPHNRITFSCDDEHSFRLAIDFMETAKEQFLREVATLCETSGAIFVGGEKSAGSECEMIPLLGGPERCPPVLAEKFKLQAKTIADASSSYNWRTIDPYLRNTAIKTAR